MEFRFVLALSGCLVTVPLALAAESSDDLPEIVVTAQRRPERLQDVSAAITALSGDSLNQLHLQGTGDLAERVPSLAFNVLAPGESTLTMRGLGTSYGLSPTVSYYLNETPLDIRTDGAAGAPDIDFFDVARIEVLRGPQGSLYGSSSMGGAIRILTAQPDPKAFAINAEIGASSMDGGGAGYLAKSAVNLPVTDNSAVRLVGTFEHTPGYIERAAPGNFASVNPAGTVTATRINDADIKGGRIIGLWKPADALTITPSIIISDISAANSSAYFSGLPRFTTVGTYATPLKSKLVVENLLASYDWGFATLMSSTSALTRNVRDQSDFTVFAANLAAPFGLSYPPNYPTVDVTTSHNDGFIQEFRLASPTEQRLRYVAGVYFSHYRQHSTETINSGDFAGALGLTTGPNLYSFDQSLVDQQMAVFADLTFKVLPVFDVTVGERHYVLRDSLENTSSGVLGAPAQPLIHAKASGNSPRLVLTYRPFSDTTVYATAARGYRPGGPNVGLPKGLGCALAGAYSPLYNPDSVWNYELGAKTEFLQRRLTMDVAAYRIDWKGVQQGVTDPGCGYIFVANVGDAVSKGLEAEVKFKPIESLLLSASGTYTKATFTSIAAAFQGAAAEHSGDSVPDVPQQKFNVGAEYNRPIGADYHGYLHLDWSHLGAVPTGFTYHDTRPAYSSLDAAVGMRTDHYDVSVYAHNLTNSKGILSIMEGTIYSYGDALKSEIATPPRVIGIDFKFHY